MREFVMFLVEVFVFPGNEEHGVGGLTIVQTVLWVLVCKLLLRCCDL